LKSKVMKRILIGLCALSLCSGLAVTPKASAQVTITIGPAVDDSGWVWNEEYRCWIWNGPEFEGDYEGHPYSWWHHRHEGGGDRDHRPPKIETERHPEGQEGEQRHEEQRQVDQPRVEQQKIEGEQPKVEQRKEEKEQPKVEERKVEGEKKEQQPKAEEKGKPERSKEKPKEGEKKEDKPQ
jgi:hypothetical protein